MVFYKSRKQYRKKSKAARKSANMPKATAKAVKAIVKQQMNKVIEMKHADYQFEPFAINGLYHNTWYLMETDPLTLLQGVQDSENLNPPNRLGDTVYTKGIKYNCMFYNFNDRPNLAYRILILLVKPDTPSIINPCLHPQLISNICMPVDYENSRIKKVLYDKVFTFNNNTAIPGSTVIRDTKWHWEHYIKLNKVTQYEDGNNSARNYTVNMWVVAYDTVSALSSDNIARFTYSRRHYYQDA
jgi:hypothetical protein